MPFFRAEFDKPIKIHHKDKAPDGLIGILLLSLCDEDAFVSLEPGKSNVTIKNIKDFPYLQLVDIRDDETATFTSIDVSTAVETSSEIGQGRNLIMQGIDVEGDVLKVGGLILYKPVQEQSS